MSKETEYADQLTELGVYHPAFNSVIHQLCMQERELRRTEKRWRDETKDSDEPPELHKLYPIIRAQRRDIAYLRDCLGLTPKGLEKLQGKQAGKTKQEQADSLSAKLDRMAERCKHYER